MEEAPYQKPLFKLAIQLLNKPRNLSLLTHDSSKELASNSNDYFVDRIKDIREELTSMSVSLLTLTYPSTFMENQSEYSIAGKKNPSMFSVFEPVS